MAKLAWLVLVLVLVLLVVLVVVDCAALRCTVQNCFGLRLSACLSCQPLNLRCVLHLFKHPFPAFIFGRQSRLTKPRLQLATHRHNPYERHAVQLYSMSTKCCNKVCIMLV